MVLNLVECMDKTNRNIITNNYFALISLVKKIARAGLIIVGTIKKNMRCILQQFLQKTKVVTTFDKLGFENSYTSLLYYFYNILRGEGGRRGQKLLIH